MSDRSSQSLCRNLKKSICDFVCSFLKRDKHKKNNNAQNLDTDDDSEREQNKLIEQVKSFSEIDITQAIIPAVHLITVSYYDTPETIIEQFANTSITRMPVYKSNLDNIVGFIHVKDMLRYFKSQKALFNIEEVLRPLLYVPRSIKCADLLRRMRAEVKHIAVVFDEYGCIEGITTIEKLLEEVFGDIVDEHNKTTMSSKINKISNSEYILDATLGIEDAGECFDDDEIFSNEDGEYNTIGGFILAFLDRIPLQGESFVYNDSYQIDILNADERKINLIRITKLQISLIQD